MSVARATGASLSGAVSGAGEGPAVGRLARRTNGSGGRTRTGDTAIMSRLLFRLSYTASGATPPTLDRAPIRNRTVDLLLTMETLCRLSYWGSIRTGARVNGQRRLYRTTGRD